MASLPATTSIITAVAVLYQQDPAASDALNSLLSLLRQDESLARRFSVLIYDNSPQEHSFQLASCSVAFHHDPANGGLASAYNYALKKAEADGSPWLLLLDQDTRLTRDFLCELASLAEELLPARDIGAIVPKLFSHGTMYSPEAHFFDQLQHPFPHRSHALSSTAQGLQATRISAYNSGAALRVGTLRALGGFPSDFWLDYLDHAFFHMLHQQGSRVYVMRAALEQQLSHYDLNSVPLWRHRNVLAAQTLFVKRFGGLRERLLYRVWLLQMARLSFRQCKDWRVWFEKLLHAALLPSKPFHHRQRYTG